MLSVSRPSKYDYAIAHNDHVYVGHVLLPSNDGIIWSRGLVARRRIPRGATIARYTGKSTPVADVSGTGAYLMSATSTQGNVVIDGDPKYKGICGFANYAPWAVANGMFVDDLTTKVRLEPDFSGNFVVLIAKHEIPQGQEVRVDYDTASQGDYRKQILLRYNIDAAQLDSNFYLRARWPTPQSLGRYVSSPTHTIERLDKLISNVSRLRPCKRKRGRPSGDETFVQF